MEEHKVQYRRRRIREKRNVTKLVLKFFKILLALGILNIILTVSAIRVGLFPRIQTVIVTSTMTTLSHQYIAKIFASDEMIKHIMNSNRVVTTKATTDKSAINVSENNQNSTDSNATEVQKPVVKDEIQLIDIQGEGYKGHMLIVDNPKRIKLAVTNNLTQSGTKLNDLINQENGIGGINAGGFSDKGGVGNGGTPTGIIVKNGEVLWRDQSVNSYSIVGFDKDGILTLGDYTVDQIKQNNIVDAVSFGPYLIVNNQPTEIIGDGGWGINPRTVIGQKADGTVLLLEIDGRQVSSVGTTIKEIQNLMIQYGAVNASNLDGGSSTVMYYQDKLINSPCSPYGERPLPNAFIISK